jgi:GT2 family glycosyltransferase
LADHGELEYLPVNCVAIILLNWNNWQDTLECLESLLRLDYPSFYIIICDNGSTDHSLKYIRAWADGRLDILPESRQDKGVPNPVPKPLALIEYDRSLAEAGGDRNASSQIVLIRNGENLGFAGGNNVGLRYVMSRKSSDYIWILNNDTIVDSAALKCLVSRMKERPNVGICGATVMNYWKPGQVDALGGAFYSRWLGLAWHLGRWRKRPQKIDPVKIEGRMDYVVGSSMFVSSAFLENVGLLEESYFLYYEELDWAIRARERFSLGYSSDSLVYHKVGGSIGTSSHPGRKSLICDFYTLRNRLVFSRRHYSYVLPTIYMGLFAALIVRLLLGKWQKALLVWRLMINPYRSFEECGI